MNGLAPLPRMEHEDSHKTSYMRLDIQILLQVLVSLFVLSLPTSGISLHDYQLRLSHGQYSFEGRVEVFFNFQWQAFCGTDVNTQFADIICTELGFTKNSAILWRLQMPVVQLPWLDVKFTCGEDAQNLSMCTAIEMPDSDWCFRDLNIQCWNQDGVIISSYMGARLMGGPNPSEGRLEVMMNGEWGTVCDDYWGDEESNVVCHQLGYYYADMAPSFIGDKSPYGTGSGRILLDDVRCTGVEGNLGNCSYITTHNCHHTENVIIKCQTEPSPPFGESVELTKPFKSNCGLGGIVRSKFENLWWNICLTEAELQYSNNVSTVICRQMEFPTFQGTRFYRSSVLGKTRISSIRCTGEEEDLSQCTIGMDKPRKCEGDSVVEVCCGNPVSRSPPSLQDVYGKGIEVRLTGSFGGYKGRVEVKWFSYWYTICDDGWDINDAEVVCRQIGYPGALMAQSEPSYQQTGYVLLEGVDCYGNETNLGQCRHSGIGNHDCHHQENAFVECKRGYDSDGEDATGTHSGNSMTSGAIIFTSLVVTFTGIVLISAVIYAAHWLITRWICEPRQCQEQRIQNDLHSPVPPQRQYYLSNPEIQSRISFPPSTSESGPEFEEVIPLNNDHPPPYNFLQPERDYFWKYSTEDDLTGNSTTDDYSGRSSSPPPPYESAVSRV